MRLRLLAFLAPGSRFGVLLASLGLLAFVPFVIPARFARALVPVLFIVVLLSALVAVSDERKRVLLGVPFAAVGALFSILAAFSHAGWVEVAADVALLAFLTVVVITIIAFVLRAHNVDLGTVLAAVCVYLMLALMWGVAYQVLQAFDPTAFAIAHEAQARGVSPLMYFSFVTITTLGYGDVTPVTGFARVLSVLEAVIGQLYLVVLVARLVGLYTADEGRRLSSTE